jgi:glycosyltransferase involved in cell wall biosynthesis
LSFGAFGFEPQLLDCAKEQIITNTTTCQRHQPEVSVVICVRNMAQYLSRQLDAVLAQKIGFHFEIVVADNASTDGSREIALTYSSRDQRVRVIDAPVIGLNAARNRGIEAALAAVVVISDADDEVEPGWLAAVVGALEPATYVAGSLRLGGPESAIVRRRWSVEDQAAAVPHWIQEGFRTASGNNCCFYKAMWASLGGFDEKLSGAGDETDFFVRAGRAGFGFREAPDAVVGVGLRATTLEVWRHGYRFGKHVIARWNNSVWSWPRAALIFSRLAAQLPKVAIQGRGWYAWVSALATETGMAVQHVKGIRLVKKPSAAVVK